MIVTLTLYLKHSTERAWLFNTHQHEVVENRSVWVPRSVCRTVVKHPQEGVLRRHCTVEVQQWFAKKENLLECQKH